MPQPPEHQTDNVVVFFAQLQLLEWLQWANSESVSFLCHPPISRPPAPISRPPAPISRPHPSPGRLALRPPSHAQDGKPQSLPSRLRHVSAALPLALALHLLYLGPSSTVILEIYKAEGSI